MIVCAARSGISSANLWVPGHNEFTAAAMCDTHRAAASSALSVRVARQKRLTLSRFTFTVPKLIMKLTRWSDFEGASVRHFPD